MSDLRFIPHINKASAISINPINIGLVSNFSIEYIEKSCKLNPSNRADKMNPISKAGRLNLIFFIIIPKQEKINKIT